MSAVVDTNVLVFDTFEDSDSHGDALEALDSLEEWVIPGIVFHEYVWFMKDQKVTAEDTRMKVNEYLMDTKTRFHPIDADDIAFAVGNVRRLGEYNDLVILSSAKRLGLPLLTFDKRLAAKAREFGVTPAI
ncbi:MAG TPA: PIN domain-containing protein [Candidatus Bathyarchaeia archaeon]|jgi:predicted nucleic acid-binding protein